MVARASTLFALILILFASSGAEAHTGADAVTGWFAGFTHPLYGWDHLLVMLAVGIWAAQQGGRAGWSIPLTFLAAMAVGGFVGAGAGPMAGIDAVILLSVVVSAGLVIARVRLPCWSSIGVVALFAFFHGFAHGSEMPSSSSLVVFGSGFLLATALLHFTGYAIAYIAATLAAMMTGAAQAAEPALAGGAEEIVVYGRHNSLLGIAASATRGTVGALQLSSRPILRAGEVLETVPGMIITQHAGGGKANQYFMRGFNLDHGTDFATTVDGMPVNLRSHGHGQGYSDINFVIPEFIERVNYAKGVYDPQNGDFSSAGAAHIETFKKLPSGLAVVEGGMYGYGRAVIGDSFGAGGGGILLGLEVAHHDGPWVRGDDFWKKNGLVTYSRGDAGSGFSLTARGYHGRWNSTDQIAAGAVADGTVPLYGSLDDTTDGKSQRYSLQGEWHRADASSSTALNAYAFYYDLDLLSNFTYFLTDPVTGDQFEQNDKRITTGLNASHAWRADLLGRESRNTLGFQFRNDSINNGLFNTKAGVRIDKSAEDGTFIPAVTRQDGIVENSFAVYAQNSVTWNDWLRTEAGARGDLFTFNVRNARAENSGRASDVMLSPRVSIIAGPWVSTEFYLQAGYGFHSNDARGILTRVDPVTGGPVTPADPLVRTKGAEVGVRTTAAPGLQSTVSLWALEIDSELLFVGDAGTTEASRPSRRYGVEFANYYMILEGLTVDLDVALSHAHYRDAAPEGRHIPGAIEVVASSGLTYQNPIGIFGSVRLRYFGARPLIEDDSMRSGKTVLMNAQVGYKLNERWSVAADIFNVLNAKDHDIDYFYESRVSPTAEAREDIHFHPVEPRQVRLTFRARY